MISNVYILNTHKFGIDILSIQINITLKLIIEDNSIGLSNGLLPSDNKPLPKPVLNEFSDAIWRR